MARIKEADMELARKAEAEMKKIIDSIVCFRLQAIVSCAHHPIILVAPIMGVHRSTLWRWIKRFREEGVEGLRDRPKGHNPMKLSEEQHEQVAQWLTRGKTFRDEYVHWTLAKLSYEIERAFGIRVSKTSLWHLVRKLGFRQKVPRPVHAKSDPLSQKVFKKNC